jgi:hypothetical protein
MPTKLLLRAGSAGASPTAWQMVAAWFEDAAHQLGIGGIFLASAGLMVADHSEAPSDPNRETITEEVRRLTTRE